VVGMHALCLAGPVVDAPCCLLSRDTPSDSKGWFLVVTGPVLSLYA